MKSLTKVNFWDALNKDYPQSVKVFCQWIDSYKQSVDWLNLFNDGIVIRDSSTTFHKTQAPKFHELPIMMQYGILTLFFAGKDISIGVAAKKGRKYLGVIFDAEDDNEILLKEWPEMEYAIAELVHDAFKLLESYFDEKSDRNKKAREESLASSDNGMSITSNAETKNSQGREVVKLGSIILTIKTCEE